MNLWDMVEETTFSSYFSSSSLALEDLLVDENILTEMQNLNPQLLDYIEKNKNYVIQKLIEYITVMPLETDTDTRKYRLPYISSEMLAINSPLIYCSLLGEGDHLKRLFQFLGTKDAEDELLTGYFENVMKSLYKNRQIQFSKAVSDNLHLLIHRLEHPAVGPLLQNTIILQFTPEKTLYNQRKQILSKVIEEFTAQNSTTKTREACAGILIEVAGKHKSFSSGDELLKAMLGNGDLLTVYEMVDAPEICTFLAGILSKSALKIYDPELDEKLPIFSLPPEHRQLLSSYLCLLIDEISPLLHTPANEIAQQDGHKIKAVHPRVLQYFELVAETLENQIQQFTVVEEVLQIGWSCMRMWPRNDILLFQIGRVFGWIAKGTGVKGEEAKKLMLEKFQIANHFAEVWENKEERSLRPHLFQIWKNLHPFPPMDNPSWKSLCDTYLELIPLYSKTAGLNYERPVDQKIVIDEQDEKEERQESEHEAKTEGHPQQNKQSQDLQNVSEEFQTKLFRNLETQQTQMKKPEFDEFAEMHKAMQKQFDSQLAASKSQEGAKTGFEFFDFQQEKDSKSEKKSDFASFDDFM